jgi:hypothetical protein
MLGQDLVSLEYLVLSHAAMRYDALAFAEQIWQNAGIAHRNRARRIGHIEANVDRALLPLYGPANNEPAYPEVTFFRILTGDYVGDLDEKHHIVLERPKRKSSSNCDAKRGQSNGQHALLSWFHS